VTFLLIPMRRPSLSLDQSLIEGTSFRSLEFDFRANRCLIFLFLSSFRRYFDVIPSSPVRLLTLIPMSGCWRKFTHLSTFVATTFPRFFILPLLSLRAFPMKSSIHKNKPELRSKQVSGNSPGRARLYIVEKTVPHLLVIFLPQ